MSDLIKELAWKVRRAKQQGFKNPYSEVLNISEYSKRLDMPIAQLYNLIENELKKIEE